MLTISLEYWLLSFWWKRCNCVSHYVDDVNMLMLDLMFIHAFLFGNQKS